MLKPHIETLIKVANAWIVLWFCCMYLRSVETNTNLFNLSIHFVSGNIYALHDLYTIRTIPYKVNMLNSLYRESGTDQMLLFFYFIPMILDTLMNYVLLCHYAAVALLTNA